jgi:demethylmenaquinone methyltransferase / 2-methoxy-6-polyprenyl-1,4-benzoquinol methylase
VQALPIASAFADCAAMAYGIRNVQNPAACIRDVFRVLKPGGCFALLELTRPKNKFLHWGHELYLKKLLPRLGRWLTDNQQAYQYLSQSIQTFIAPEKLCSFMKEAGFIRTQIQPLTGGIATIILGYKPQ